MKDHSLTERCADYVLSVRYENLPDDVIRMAKLCVIDLFGCIVGAAKTPEADIINNLVREEGSGKQATMLGLWEKTSMLNASLANGFTGHIYEMDDVYTAASMHPGLPVIPTAVAVAEYLNKSGKELIEAIVAGYEIVTRVGECVFPSHYEKWHTTATCGTFGATAAAGKLLGLSREQLVWAFGSAGSQASGVWQFSDDDAMTKYLHCGKANYNGLLSALLAAKGLTGARRILEGDRGFVKAASRETNPEKAFVGLGDGTYRIMKTGFKPYPSCGHSHTSVSAALNLYQAHKFKPEAIDRVVVKTNATSLRIASKNNETVSGSREAKFSLRFCVAAALYHGAVDNRTIGDECIFAPDFLKFVKKIEVGEDPALTAKYPELLTGVVTVISGGSEYTEQVNYSKGDPRSPFTDQEFYDKYLSQARMAVSEQSAQTLLERCKKLETFAGLRTLFDGL